MQPGHFLVELLGQDVNGGFVDRAVLPQVEGCQRLVGEAVAHDKAGVTGGATEVDQPSFGEQEEFPAVGEDILVELGLDVDPFDPGEVIQLVDLDLVVEVANVRHHGLILHFGEVLHGDDILVAGGGDVDVGTTEGLLDGGDFVSLHSGLQGIDRIDFGDDDPGALSA